MASILIWNQRREESRKPLAQENTAIARRLLAVLVFENAISAKTLDVEARAACRPMNSSPASGPQLKEQQKKRLAIEH
jgi:hypothetical protein